MGVGYNPKIETNGLVGYWDAGNVRSYSGSGTTWTDLSGNGNHGAMSNVTFASGYMTFNGIDSSVDCGSSDTLYSANITLEVLAYPTGWGAGNFGRFIDRSNNATVGYSIQKNIGITGILYGRSGTAGQNIQASNSVTLNQWQHYSITHTGTTATIYKNGVSILSGTLTAISSGTTSFYIGNRAAADRAFNGRIALVKVYNRALSAQEVSQNFNALRGRYGI